MKSSSKLRDWANRLRRGNMVLLRLFLRLVPSENQRVFVLALISGALCGLAAVFFHLSIIGSENRLIDRAMHAHGHTWIWWTILIPTAGGLLSGALLKYVVPGARGSGIPQVKVAYAIRGGRVPFIDAVGKFLIGVLQIGTGSSLGREGPTFQICAGVSNALGRGAALSRDNLRRLLPVGAAAGIAAAFNAPIAAVITDLPHSSYPVLDEGKFLGIVTEARLRRTSAEGGNQKKLKIIVKSCPQVFSDHPLVRAVVRMQQSDSRQLAVLDNREKKKFVGLLTMSDIVRAHAEAAMSAADPDRTVSPDFTEAAELLERSQP